MGDLWSASWRRTPASEGQRVSTLSRRNPGPAPPAQLGPPRGQAKGGEPVCQRCPGAPSSPSGTVCAAPRPAPRSAPRPAPRSGWEALVLLPPRAPGSAPRPGPRPFSRDRGRGRARRPRLTLPTFPAPTSRGQRLRPRHRSASPLSCLRVSSNRSGSGLPPPILLYLSFSSLKRALTAVVYTPRLSPPSTLQPPRPVLSREKVPKSCPVV